MRYALIANGAVVNVIEAEADFAASLGAAYDAVIDVTDVSAGPGWSYDGVNFQPPAINAEPVLTVTLDRAIALPTDLVTATVAVAQTDGSFAPVTETYYVPLIGIDGLQAKLLTVPVADGQATVTFSLATPGIYTLDLAKIRPRPTSQLAANPELIVTE